MDKSNQGSPAKIKGDSSSEPDYVADGSYRHIELRNARIRTALAYVFIVGVVFLYSDVLFETWERLHAPSVR